MDKEPWLDQGIDNEDIDAIIDGCKGELDLQSPVESIDQLFAQAAGLDGVFLGYKPIAARIIPLPCGKLSLDSSRAQNN